jgi:hypothetical protein
VQHLERDVAFDGELARAIDRAERAARDERVDAKTSRQHRAGQIVVGAQRAWDARTRSAQRELRAAHVPQTRERRRLRHGLRCIASLQQARWCVTREVLAEARHRDRARARIESLAAQPRE